VSILYREWVGGECNCQSLSEGLPDLIGHGLGLSLRHAVVRHAVVGVAASKAQDYQQDGKDR
jgi:hypothetical protein